MEYRYEKEAKNYEDYASGRVLRNAPGTTAFPVRLASELYQRGSAYLQSSGRSGKRTVYDPCCGGAHMLATIGLMHGEEIAHLIGSDVDARVVDIARYNAALVNRDGLERRMEQLQSMADAFGKQSHWEAIESAKRLKELVEKRGTDIQTTIFQADATAAMSAQSFLADLVITDVPYGEVAQWSSEVDDPIGGMLEHLRERLSPESIVVIVADKKQRIDHAQYQRLEKLKIGKRVAVILKLKERG